MAAVPFHVDFSAFAVASGMSRGSLASARKYAEALRLGLALDTVRFVRLQDAPDGGLRCYYTGEPNPCLDLSDMD